MDGSSVCAALGSQLKAHSHQQMKSCRVIFTDSAAFTQLVYTDATRMHGQLSNSQRQSAAIHARTHPLIWERILCPLHKVGIYAMPRVQLSEDLLQDMWCFRQSAPAVVKVWPSVVATPDLGEPFL